MITLLTEEHLEKRGVRDAHVLRAVRSVPRHEFVPLSLREFAYEDRPLSIGFGATISQPYMVAVMTELLEAQPGHIVLEIGTGSGYQAAVLSRLVKTVFSIEIVPELAASAEAALRRLGYGNIEIRNDDGYRGWEEQAPFDRIILTAAPPEIPPALLQQLRPGGRLVAPVGRASEQELILIEKLPDGQLRERSVLPVSFVPMVSSDKGESSCRK